MSVEKLKEQLGLYDESQASNKTNDSDDSEESVDEVDPALVKLLQQSFLRPEKKDANDARARGHELEEPFLQELWELNQTTPDFLPFDLQVIYRNGMCSKGDGWKRSIKDTSDAVGVYCQQDDESDDGSDSSSSSSNQKLGCLPIECKARVSPNTIKGAMQNLRARLGPEQFSLHAVPLVRCQDFEMNDYVPDDHENFQLLHHVYTYGAKEGLIIIGDNESLMYCVLVSFSDELLKAYHRIVGSIYKDVLYPFWGPKKDFPFQSIEEALKSDSLKKAKVDMESFMTTWDLWRALNVSIDHNTPKFPLPPCSRLIPYLNSFWNKAKHLSDTTTSLIDTCQEKLGVRTPQTWRIAWINDLFSVVSHRSFHSSVPRMTWNSMIVFLITGMQQMHECRTSNRLTRSYFSFLQLQQVRREQELYPSLPRLPSHQLADALEVA